MEESRSRKRDKEGVAYKDASSDDEFAKENFILPSDDEESGKESEENDSDGFSYKIQFILARKALAPRDWIKICENMNTREVTRGSVWQQPDEEYFDQTDKPLEKFLIKWSHASFLHVSWETEKDLLEMVGAAAKNHIKKFLKREWCGVELFEDLGRGELFPSSYITIDRVLDVDDQEVDVLRVNWEKAPIPPADGKQLDQNNDETTISETEAPSLPTMEVVTSNQDNKVDDSVIMLENECKNKDDLEQEEEDRPTARRSLRNRSMRRVVIDSDEEDEEMLFDEDEEENISKSKPKKSNKNMIVDSDDENNAENDEEEDTKKKSKKSKEKKRKQKQLKLSFSSGVDNEEGEDGGDESECEVVEVKRKKSKKNKKNSKKSKKSSNKITDHLKNGDNETKKKNAKFKYLHSSVCWLTIKWEGMNYTEATFEDINDIIRCNVKYEQCLREFYKREQQEPKKSAHAIQIEKVSSRSRVINTAFLENNADAPSFRVGELRDYQWEGVRWLLFNWTQGRNSILADEMGLGKTIQTAAYLQMLKTHRVQAGPFLIVAPLSTLVNWQREITAWTDMDAIIYHGSQEDRELLREYEFHFLANKKANSGYKVEVVIVSPETCMNYDSKTQTGRMRRELAKIHWDVMVVDEAHKLKNYDSKTSATLREEYSYSNSLLLTGTPLQNNTDELWTLLNFVARDEFADREGFIEEFGDLKTATQLEKLHSKLKPYLLRREKDNVEKLVPPKEEIIIEIELTAPQKQYYRALYEQKTNFLYRGGAKDGPNLTNLAMELRKCCNHPFLIKGAEVELSKHFENESKLDVIIKSSGKLVLLDKLLVKLKADGHRVLIFSQFRIMLNIIEDYMLFKGFQFERVDGSITGKKRQASIDRYCKSTDNNELFAMLLSTRAGGVGINLTAADVVIIYDSDWNPQNDLQAQARAHRIGQTKPVKVYRLLTKKTYETVMFRAASIKLGLDYAVMHNMANTVPTTDFQAHSNNNNNSNKSKSSRGKKKEQSTAVVGISTERAEHASDMSKKELENLLKHGAYDIFREEVSGVGAQESKKFCEETIDQILSHSSVIMHNENRSSTIVSNSFSKASFVHNDGNNCVDIDDPQFWSKVVGLTAGREEEENGLRRKCRDNVSSYKEPGMAIFRYDNKDKNESSDSSDDEKEDDNIIVPAEYTTDNLQLLLSSLSNRGYGNWEMIKKDTKLKWSYLDIMKGCRYCLLQLLLWSCITITKSKSNNKNEDDNKDGENVDDNKEEDSDDEDNNNNNNDNKEAKPMYDIAFLESHLRKFKVSRVAILVYQRMQQAKAQGLIQQLISEVSLLKEFETFHMLSNSNTTSDENTTPLPLYLQAFPKFDDVLASVKLVVENNNGAKMDVDETNAAPADSNTNNNNDTKLKLNEIIKALVGLKLPEDFTEWTQEKAFKIRGAARAKLYQIEDMYEMFLSAEHFKFEITKQEEATNEVIQSNDTNNNEVTMTTEEQGPAVVANTPPVQTLTYGNVDQWPAIFKLVDNSNNATAATAATTSTTAIVYEDGWTIEDDIKLLNQIQKIGWPEGKRKFAHLEELFKETGTTMGEYFNQKYLVKRVRDLATVLRTYTDNTPVKVIVPKMSKAEREQIANAKRAEKELLQNAKKEKEEQKKFVQTVLKTIARIGRPRSNYAEIRELLLASNAVTNEVEEITTTDEDYTTITIKDKLSYLLTWEQLAQECGMTRDDIPKLQETVDAIYTAYYSPELYASTSNTSGKNNENATDNNNASEDANEEDANNDNANNATNENSNNNKLNENKLLIGATYKIIESSCKSEILMDYVRQLVINRTFDDLKKALRTSCPGPSPTQYCSKKDTTLPVWWKVEHDVALLKLTLKHGINQWKTIVLESCVNTPSNFVLPNNKSGSEVVTTLSAKVAEKRVTKTMLLILSSSKYKTEFAIPPATPRKTTRQDSSVLPTDSSSNSSSSSKKSATSIVSTANRTFGVRPTWVTSLKPSAVATTVVTTTAETVSNNKPIEIDTTIDAVEVVNTPAKEKVATEIVAEKKVVTIEPSPSKSDNSDAMVIGTPSSNVETKKRSIETANETKLNDDAMKLAKTKEQSSASSVNVLTPATKSVEANSGSTNDTAVVIDVDENKANNVVTPAAKAPATASASKGKNKLDASAAKGTASIMSFFKKN